MLINGTPVRDTAFKSRLALVWQSDILLPTATVRPSILPSSLLLLTHVQSLMLYIGTWALLHRARHL